MVGDFAVSQCFVEGNNGQMIESKGMWSLFRGDIEAMITDYPAKVTNVCNYGGAKISGATVGSLPSYPVPIGWRLHLGKSGVESPLARVSDILATIGDISEKVEQISNTYHNDNDYVKTSEALQVSNLATSDLALFQYVFRALFSSMLMRIHLDYARGVDAYESQSNVITVMTETMLSLLARMRGELHANT
jgi:hypothetical protein